MIRQLGLEFKIGPPHNKSQKRDVNQEAKPVRAEAQKVASSAPGTANKSDRAVL